MSRTVLRRFSASAALAIILLAAAPAAATTPVSFAPYQVYSVGSRAQSVAIADVTGDGSADVVLSAGCCFDPDSDFKLLVFPQMPDGTLGTPVKYATDAQYGQMALDTGDLNGDGRTDVALATPSGIDIFYQGAGGGLQPPQLIATSNEAFGAVVADVDLDGRQDIVTNTRDGVLWLRANGSGFSTSIVTTDPQWEVEVGDLTGDHLPDIAGCKGLNLCAPEVNVFAQRPRGEFREYEYSADVRWWPACGIAVGDVTGDRRDDVTMSICGNQPNALLNVFPQAGGRLGSPVVYSSYDTPDAVLVADMNRDGLGDVVTLHGGWNRAGVYLQEPGGLGPESLFPIPYATSYNPKGLDVGDINGDGRPDIVLADYNSGLVVLREQ
jgi:FG-GAP-like repeat